MKITVAICTWNRCALLNETLEHVARLEIPSGVEWEVLVVNNNSTDATDEVLASFAARLPLHKVREIKPGLSNARNRAVCEAVGEYILWTDDDVLVDELWLKAYCEAFTRWPDAAIFGGNIKPWFEGTPPDWLVRVWSQVASAYASRDLGEQDIPLSQEVMPFGANFAVRTFEQRKYVYDPQLGVRPDSAIGGEETTVIKSMLDDGLTGRWVPGARVRHYIPEKRQTISFLRRYYKGYGEFCAAKDTNTNEAKILGTPRWLWREAITAEARYRVRRHIARPEIWIEDLITSSQAWGQLKGFQTMRSTSETRQPGEDANSEMI